MLYYIVYYIYIIFKIMQRRCAQNNIVTAADVKASLSKKIAIFGGKTQTVKKYILKKL